MRTTASLNSRISNPGFKISIFHQKAGFTLLEVMIALAIVGAVVITILQTVNHHAEVSYGNTLTTRMFLLAREQISEMEQNPRNAKGITPDTDFTFDNSVSVSEDEEVVELTTHINGHGKELVLGELIVNRGFKSQED